MRPGGGARGSYAHSINKIKLPRNGHIRYNFEAEDEQSLFVPETLQEEVRALKRKRTRSSSANNEAIEEDCEAMFAPMPDEEESIETQEGETEGAPASQPQGKEDLPIIEDTINPTPAPVTQIPAKKNVSDAVAARAAAIRASRTPQPRREGTPATATSSARTAVHGRESSVGVEIDSSVADSGSPSMSILELKRAELARVQAARAAVNHENEAMLQAIEVAKVMRN